MTIAVAVVILISTYIVAASVFSRVFPEIKGFSRIGLISAGSLLFLMWATFISAWLFGFEKSYWVLAVVSAVPAIEQLGSVKPLLSAKYLKIFFRKHTVGTLCVLGIVFLIGALLHTRLYMPGPTGVYSGGSTWADLSLHSALINHFAQTDRIRFDSPIWSGTPNTYPWLFDLYTAWLVKAGFSLRWALLISSWQALIPLAVLFIAIGKKLSLKKVGLVSATLWFFLAGGFGFIYFFKDLQQSTVPLATFLQSMPHQYTNDATRGLYFSTPITDILLPQRGALAGLGMIFASIILLQHWLTTTTKRTLACIGCIIGLLPLIHVHLFLVGIGLLVLTLVAKNWTKWSLLVFTMWAATFGFVLLLATPQLHWLLSGSAGTSFLAIDPLWMYTFGPGIPFELPLFFFLNFSIAFPLALWSFTYFHSKKHTFILLLYAAMVGILVLSLSIRFQPNPWDNIKFLIVALAIACLLAGRVAELWWPKRKWLVIALLAVGSFSGLLSVVREFTHVYRMFTYEDIAEVRTISALLPPNSVLATAPHHKVPLGMLGGYSLYSAYPGWLWTYGIEYGERESTLRQAYAGDAAAIAKLREDGVTHIVFSPLEYQEFRVSEQWRNQQPVISAGNTTIIELNELLVQ